MTNGRIPMIVKAPNGTDLRREPHTNPKTEDGEDNVILSLPKGTYVRVESEDIYATDKYKWALVTLKFESKMKTGWVIYDDLSPDELYEAPDTTAYTFRFGGKKYKIFEDKLAAARGQFIFENRLPGSRQITINRRRYFTTRDKIDAMKSPQWRWIEEI